MNLGIFAGHLGRDAELNRMGNGDAVANFSVAVNTGTRDKPATLWVDCAFFGKRAEGVAQYLLKGTKVTVSGRLALDTFVSQKDGKERTTLRLNVQDLDIHWDKKAGGASAQAAPAAGGKRPVTEAEPFNDDIPF